MATIFSQPATAHRPSWLEVCRRNLHIVLAMLAGLAGTCAFLLWGPIGIGNGPLEGPASNGGFGAVGGKAPLAILLPLSNRSRGTVIIDSVDLAGGGGYPAPRVVASEAMTHTDCADLFPVRMVPAGFALTEGCGGRPTGPLEGLALRASQVDPPFGALAVSPPRPGTCWLLTDVIVHYHVGDRYYAGTYLDVLADCAPRGSWPAEGVASQLAVQASG